MKVSMKVDYGVRALIDLAQHVGEGPSQTAEIAQRQSVPEPYLDQLLTTLRKAGFIHSRRGPQGGHLLARGPEQISLGEVINTLEGHVPPVNCLDGSLDCTMVGTCAQQEVWRNIDAVTQNILNATSIAELAAKQGRRERPVMYYI
ncbi:MAG: Rrf2 family transcriptional regulator [Chloroflexi bacterium]|nr:Rrf2 family transcriptional regulator [Chloroflexota bacterium]